MTITKVKSTGDKVHIEYEQLSDSGLPDEYSITCNQKAKPEFYLALNELAKHVLHICDLPKEYAEDLSVIGVSFSYRDEIMGAVISARKMLLDCDSPLFLNTPHMPEKAYGKTAGNKLLPQKTVEALDELIQEAEAYVNGDRAQLKLALEGTKSVPKKLRKQGVELSLA